MEQQGEGYFSPLSLYRVSVIFKKSATKLKSHPWYFVGPSHAAKTTLSNCIENCTSGDCGGILHQNIVNK